MLQESPHAATDYSTSAVLVQASYNWAFRFCSLSCQIASIKLHLSRRVAPKTTPNIKPTESLDISNKCYQNLYPNGHQKSLDFGCPCASCAHTHWSFEQGPKARAHPANQPYVTGREGMTTGTYTDRHLYLISNHKLTSLFFCHQCS